VTELNAGNGSVVQILSNASYGFDSPQGITMDGTHVWIADGGGDSSSGGSVTELNAANGGWVRTLSGASYGFADPWAIAVDGTHVWVANHQGNSVTELPAG
jgi:hypothetical protein